MYNETVGIVGGFGGYATLNFYKRILEEFASDSERNYPHIIMDNNFTMPSRTRALLNGEGYDEIVCEIAKSLKILLDLNCKKIIIPCGTAHYFLEKGVYTLIPEAREKVLDIINILGGGLQKEKCKCVLILAAEGTLKRDLYAERLKSMVYLV